MLYNSPFKVCNSVVSSLVIELCNHGHYLIPEHFHHPKKKLHVYWCTPPTPFSSTPPSSRHPLTHFLSLDLPVLDIPCKWNHTLCGLLCLVCFTEHHVFKVHSHCSVYVLHSFLRLNNILLYGWTTFYLSINQSMDTWTVSTFGS